MNHKKVAFIVVTFAIVAALLTMYQFRLGGASGMMMGSTEPAKDAYYGGIGFSNVSPMGTVQEDVFIQKAERMPVPTSGIAVPQYPTDALEVELRSYDKSAYQGIVATNVSDYMKQLKDYLQSIGGKVLSSNQNTSNDMQSAYLSARVPTEKFDDVTVMISTNAKKVISESINSTDVTGQQVALADRATDLQEQKAKKATELSLAKTDADKKLVQAEIDRIDLQIAQLQKSQEKFNEQVRYATITVTVANTERYFNPELSAGVWDEARRAWKSLGGTSKVLAYFAVWVVVYAVIWLPVVLAVRWVWNKLHSSK